MSYLHCHTKKCYWSQDDFWSWHWSGLLKFWKWKYRPFGYNPFSLILEDIASYWKPRYIEYDSQWAKEAGFKSSRVFSWHMLWRELIRDGRKLFTQKWWTEKAFKKDYKAGKAFCPDCGCSDQFDID